MEFLRRLRVGAAAASLAAAAAASSTIVYASSDSLHPPHLHWSHDGYLDTFDHSSIRRGYHVYKEVCASCHSLDRISFRNLVGVAFTEEEAKALAAGIEVQDGPDDQGEMFMRPGKLTDRLPRPYANDKAARATNNGALPPDLSLIVKSRNGGCNYLYSLLTGYRPAPAGVTIRDGTAFNPYFPGGAIAMPQQLYDGSVEYDDGTAATITQMAKDVTIFLAWAAEPEHDERKLMGFKAMVLLSIFAVTSFYWKRLKFSVLKSKDIVVTNNKKTPTSSH